LLENKHQTYFKVISYLETSYWNEAINGEIESIMNNHTWELVDFSPRSQPLGYKWIFKRKIKANNTIDKYKARLVVKCFKQQEGVNYFDRYSHVSIITSIQTLIVITTINKLEIHQMDAKITFLKGDFNREVYMEQPEGYVINGQEKKIYNLIKSLYGLKQTPKQWNEKFDKIMLSKEFKTNEVDKYIYVKNTDKSCVIVFLYVVDMLIFGTNDHMIKSTKKILTNKLDMKELGVVVVILGIKFLKTSNGFILSNLIMLRKFSINFLKVTITLLKYQLM